MLPRIRDIHRDERGMSLGPRIVVIPVYDPVAFANGAQHGMQ